MADTSGLTEFLDAKVTSLDIAQILSFPFSVEQCHACHETLTEQPLRALCKNWHPDCFKCSVCERSLRTCYYARQEVLFCKKDYLTRFRNICHRCGKAITGPIIVIGDIRFHTECLVCSACEKFLSEEDSYALLERHKLLCDGCCGSALQSACNESSHVIQHLVLPKSQAGQQRFQVKIQESPLKNKLSPDGIRRECATLVLTSYHSSKPGDQKLTIKPGDRILEVNRQPVDDLSLDHISAILMSRPEAVFQITVERDPSSTSGRHRLLRQYSVEDCDDRKSEFRTRSISLFTRRVFKRSPHAIDQRATTSANKQSTDSNQNTVANEEEPPNNRNKASRSSSLPRSYSLSDVPKARSPIHRAQSFKNDPAHNRVFQPSDLLIGEVIGKGFFGQVLKVTHKQTGEVMVAKELVNFDDEAQANFLKEVALLKSLDHPNVLRFIGVVFKGRTLNLITEYVAGGTLRALLKDKVKPLSWSLRVKLAKDIAAGMAYLHSVDVMHRDLKSKNCLIQRETGNDEDMTAVVADFGLAKILPDRAASPLSPRRNFPSSPTDKPPLSPGVKPPPPRRRYTVVGSPYWMAPEMLNGLAYDHTVDVFSFGIVLCEIIGRVKADPTYLPRLHNFALDEEKFRLNFCSLCPETFYLIAFLCCSMDPDKRPTFAQLESWLEAMLIHLDVGIPLPSEMEFSLMPKSLMQSINESVAESVDV